MRRVARLSRWAHPPLVSPECGESHACPAAWAHPPLVSPECSESHAYLAGRILHRGHLNAASRTPVLLGASSIDVTWMRRVARLSRWAHPPSMSPERSESHACPAGRILHRCHLNAASRTPVPLGASSIDVTWMQRVARLSRWAHPPSVSPRWRAEEKARIAGAVTLRQSTLSSSPPPATYGRCIGYPTFIFCFNNKFYNIKQGYKSGTVAAVMWRRRSWWSPARGGRV